VSFYSKIFIRAGHLFSGFDNTYATTTEGRGSPIQRTGSPERTHSSRSRSVSPLRFSVADVDPEAVRAALRDFVQQLMSAERERVSDLVKEWVI